MNAQLSFTQISILIAYAAGMAGGQLLFKTAALSGPAGSPLIERLSAMMLNGFFAAAVLLYAALAVLWVWVLSFTPLSRAYVFVALAFARRLCWRRRFRADIGATRYRYYFDRPRSPVYRWIVLRLVPGRCIGS
jgi:hypothetical protein